MTQHPESPPEFIRSTPPPPRSNGGVGCFVPVLIAFFLALILAGTALLLPPFSLLDRLFGVQYVMLDAQNNAARSPDQALTLILNPEDAGQDFGVALDAQETVASIPSRFALASNVYAIGTTGQHPEQVTLSLQIPNGLSNLDLVDMYGWNSDNNAWEFVASQPIDSTTIFATVDDIPAQLALFVATPPSAPLVVVPVDVTTSLTDEVGNIASIVTPAGLQPTLTGELTGSLAAGVQQNAGYQVLPVIRNFVDPRALDIDTVTTIISNSTLRQNHIQQLAIFGTTYGGVFIDYRAIPADQRDNYTQFITDLGEALHSRNLRLGVVVPPAQNTSGTWNTGAYDWQRIGQAADYVQVQLDSVDPTMFAVGSDRLVEAMLRWGTGEISRYKLLLALSTQSQRQASGGFVRIGYSEALSPLGNVTVEGTLTSDGSIIPGEPFTASLDGLEAVAAYDEATQTSYIDYLDENENPITRVWLTTDEALNFRFSRIVEFGLAGIALPDVVYGDFADGVLQAIGNYKLALPFEPTTAELYLNWRIVDGSGVIAEATSQLNGEFSATVEAPEGQYGINAAVVSESEVSRGGLAVALAAPTATPTPLPSPTPRPTATPTNTPDPEAVALAQAQATQAAAQAAIPSGGNFSAAAPSAGSIAVGQFEYGGHVTDARSARAAGAMRSAGMTWMKVQVRYSPGGNLDQAIEAINGAREQGFKILIGTVGSPQELAMAGSDYIRGYADWLAAIARLNPDAIEVWNEPNIDREWPRGQISGAAYTEMLRTAYTAIKSANSGVIVISGAPAPTGAEAAYPGQVMNDDRFLREIVAAGGLNYMDCVGLHYNEGIVPPDARSGDPRDNYYTRYFGTMVDTYWSITGGARPICITELGYLTSQGYPSLPPYFSWASNVTLQQHAAWLAQAAALSSQSGRVRLMIVWNVDFTRYGSDPQGGYAMIRPDGSCPACEAFSAAR